MPKFRKRPVIVDAFQWQGGIVPGVVYDGSWYGSVNHYYVVTIHGDRTPVAIGDWIITEPDGVHHYPCKPDVFAKVYELVIESPVEGR